MLTVARALGGRAGGVVMMWADDADPADPPALDTLRAVCVDGIRRLIVAAAAAPSAAPV